MVRYHYRDKQQTARYARMVELQMDNNPSTFFIKYISMVFIVVYIIFLILKGILLTYSEQVRGNNQLLLTLPRSDSSFLLHITIVSATGWGSMRGGIVWGGGTFRDNEIKCRDTHSYQVVQLELVVARLS